MNKSESIADLAMALAAAQLEMKPALKHSKNPFFKSNYADLESVCAACLHTLNKHGIAVTQTTCHLESNNISVSLVTTLIHKSGQWIESIYPVHPTKQDPQSLGSALKYARRYSLAGIACVAESDDDGEEAMGRDDKAAEQRVITQNKQAPASATYGSGGDNRAVTESQITRLMAIAGENGWKDSHIKAYLSKIGLTSRSQLNRTQYTRLIENIQAYPLVTENDFTGTNEIEGVK